MALATAAAMAMATAMDRAMVLLRATVQAGPPALPAILLLLIITSLHKWRSSTPMKEGRPRRHLRLGWDRLRSCLAMRRTRAQTFFSKLVLMLHSPLWKVHNKHPVLARTSKWFIKLPELPSALARGSFVLGLSSGTVFGSYIHICIYSYAALGSAEGIFLQTNH